MESSLDGVTGHPPRQRRRCKDVKIGRTRVGKGVFAGRHYRARETVGEILGELIHDPDYESAYCFDLENGAQLEPFSPFRYVNHCCEPNCRFDFLDASAEQAKRRIFLFALREIRPGDELTIDYHWDADSAIRCRCRSPACRGWIVAADQLDDRPVGDASADP